MLNQKGFDLWADGYDESVGLSDEEGTYPFAVKEKMPEAALYQGDFSKGLAEELKRNRYDAIIATYSLHHLTDGEKAGLIENLLPLLREGGCLYIGDVAFETRAEMERCSAWIGQEWDDEEYYFAADEWMKLFPQMTFEKFSFCAGLLSFKSGTLSRKERGDTNGESNHTTGK